MHLKSLEDTKNFSESISNIIKAGDVIFLYGEIGSGKTTFTRFVINYFESKNKIKNSDVLSPTFNIVYDYDVGEEKILHYDLYRLKNYNDISQLDIFENSNEYIKIVEWPELIEQKPKDRIDIFFQYSKLINSREIKIIGLGKWKDYKFNEI
tara:strand:+ start:445 stop:900 length:456 start_codon:yes stop_codon:yes gene_type:complete